MAHQDQKELVIHYRKGSRYEVDFAEFAKLMSGLIQEKVIDPNLREWMMPNFSTSTSTDEVIASIIMMGSMQKYFTYTCEIECGIPSVTLLGEKKDYQKLLESWTDSRHSGRSPPGSRNF